MRWPRCWSANRPDDSPSLYAAAYRPFRRVEEQKIAVWPVALDVGETLPVLPFWLRDAEASILVDLEATYMEARRRSRLE
jgi:hypothetical protein